MPALAVAADLRASGAEVSFLGTRERIEADLVPAAGFEIDFVKVRGIDRRNPLRAARAGFEALGAVGASRAALRRRGADVVMGGGGFVAGPAGLAATLTGTPLVLTEADSHMGLANRLLARRARRVCLAFPIEGREGERYLVTGRPVPAAVIEADRGEARARFGIGAEARCLLVVGGSQGARSLNFAARRGLRRARRPRFPCPPSLRAAATSRSCGAGWPALHIRRATRCSPTSPTSAPCSPPRDLVLGRSGGSIFEVTAAGRPAILVPYPHATADHQSANAAWMAAGRRGDGAARRGAGRRAPVATRSRRCSASRTGWRRWPPPRARLLAPTPPGRSPTRSWAAAR